MVKTSSLLIQVVQTSAMQIYKISDHVTLPFYLYNYKFRVPKMSWLLSEDLYDFIHTGFATLAYTDGKEGPKGVHSEV